MTSKFFYFSKIGFFLVLVLAASSAKAAEGNKLKLQLGMESGVGDFRKEAKPGIGLGLTYNLSLGEKSFLGFDGHFSQFGEGASSGHSVQISVFSLGILAGHRFHRGDQNFPYFALGPATFFSFERLDSGYAMKKGVTADQQSLYFGFIGVVGIDMALRNNWWAGAETRLSHYGSNSTIGLFITLSK